MSDIGGSRDAILLIANILTKIDHEDELSENIETTKSVTGEGVEG